MPTEVAEVVLANLLLNAIQHGLPGAIHILGTQHGWVVCNDGATDERGRGFGLGLRIVERLLARHGARLQREHDAAGGCRVVVTLR